MKPVLITVSGGIAEIANSLGDDLCEIRDLDNHADDPDNTPKAFTQAECVEAMNAARLHKLAPEMLAALVDIRRARANENSDPDDMADALRVIDIIAALAIDKAKGNPIPPEFPDAHPKMQKRHAAAARALSAYGPADGSEIGDLMTDLLHLAQARGLDPQDIVENAIMNQAKEREVDDIEESTRATD